MQTSKSEVPSFIIIHDYSQSPGDCMPGEEVVGIILVYREKKYWVPWAPSHLILFDFLARQKFPKDAQQIADKMQSDPFVIEHGRNAPRHRGRPARTTRTAVKKQISRMTAELQWILTECGLDLFAKDIIRSVETSTLVVQYKIDAKIITEHFSNGDRDNYPDGVFFPINHPRGREALFAEFL